MIRGTITAMVTPFDAEGELDVETTEQLAVWLAERGADGLFVAGTTRRVCSSPRMSVSD